MSETKKLNRETTLKLIESFRKKEALWNVRSVLYRIKEVKKKAWGELSAEFNLSIEFLKKKTKGLRTMYMRERKKVEASKKAGEDTTYVSNLFYYQELGFLSSSLSKRIMIDDMPRSSSCPQPNIKEVTTNMVENNLEITELEDSSSNLSTVNEYAKNLEIKSKMLKNQQKLKRTRKHEKSVLSKAEEILKELNKEVKEQDEYSMFGNLIACKIRNLDTIYAKTTVQHLINNIIYEAQLGKYNRPTCPGTIFSITTL